MENRVEYWSKRWQKEDTPWHLKHVNRFLDKHFHHISNLKEGPCKIFVPLCGKTFDLKWICEQGHEVVGLDGVEQPILEFFQEHNLDYTKGTAEGGFPYYQTLDGKIKIYHCNLFSMTPSVCGKFDAIWDRGSLVALLPEDKLKYSSLLKQLLNEDFSYLLNTVQYDQTKYSGPPYSVSMEDVKSLYEDIYDIKVLEMDNTNADPSSPTSAKMRWNIDECYEFITLLQPRKLVT